ncbi:MAG: hypothetical protein A2020_15520 [Lentisphaerae bacterium GWF2_45_14]|nr:MAG: hypothetical protein A2020_15520 [Lentisphaerae bacterium GWF2_45_14]
MPEKDAIHTKMGNARMLVLLSVLAALGSATLATVIIIPELVYGWAGLDTYSLCLIPLLMSFLFSVATLLHGFLGGKSAQEDEEKELLAKRKDRSFDVEDIRFSSQKTFINYRKYAPYVITCLGALCIGISLALFWRQWSFRVGYIAPVSALHTAFVSSILMIVSLFGGAFCLGQSRTKDFRWLRPTGAWLIASFIAALFATLAALMNKFGYPGTDYYLRNILSALFAVLGAEFIVSFISEFYRPRTMEEERPIFESRLLCLFTEPGGFVRNIADTLDYQFGFKVSKTWIYSFFEKSLVPLFIMWIFTLWLFTCICEVGPNEIGIRSEFGRLDVNSPIRSGVHFKLPWPFGAIDRFKVDEVHQIVIGPDMSSAKDNVKKGKKKDDRVVLWTQDHYGKESRYVVAAESRIESDNSVSFLSVSMPVQFKIRRNKIAEYAYGNEDPNALLKNIGEMVAVKYLASLDILNVMSVDRGRTAEEFKNLLQQEVDRNNLGIDILFVNLHDAHPPVGNVSEAFQDVIGAREEKEKFVLDAKRYRSEIIPSAEAKAVRLGYEAEAYKINTVKVAAAEGERFIKQLKAYRAMPGIFRLRTYLDFLETDCKDSRKYIMSRNFPYEIYEINLEGKTRFDLLDVDLGDISSGK